MESIATKESVMGETIDENPSIISVFIQILKEVKNTRLKFVIDQCCLSIKRIPEMYKLQ